MKNISNLDIKRHRLGLAKELSTLAIVGVYKKASMSTKLESIALIEVLKHTEKNYSEALDLIFKLEKVNESTQLISILSKNFMNSKYVHVWKITYCMKLHKSKHFAYVLMKRIVIKFLKS